MLPQTVRCFSTQHYNIFKISPHMVPHIVRCYMNQIVKFHHRRLPQTVRCNMIYHHHHKKFTVQLWTMLTPNDQPFTHKYHPAKLLKLSSQQTRQIRVHRYPTPFTEIGAAFFVIKFRISTIIQLAHIRFLISYTNAKQCVFECSFKYFDFIIKYHYCFGMAQKQCLKHSNLICTIKIYSYKINVW